MLLDARYGYKAYVLEIGNDAGPEQSISSGEGTSLSVVESSELEKTDSERGKQKEIQKVTKEKEDQLAIPDEMTMEIIRRLPLRSAVSLSTVSPRWLTLMSQSNYTQSEQPNNFLFTSTQVPSRESELHRWFHWLTEEAVLMGNQGDAKCSQIVSRSSCLASEPIRGVMICFNGADIVVCNPSLRKFMDLPVLPIQAVCYFGFDSVSGHFKVLALSEPTGEVRSRRCPNSYFGSRIFLETHQM